MLSRSKICRRPRLHPAKIMSAPSRRLRAQAVTQTVRPLRSKRSSDCEVMPPLARSAGMSSIPVEPRCPMRALRSLSSKAGKPTTAVTDTRGEWLIAGLPTGSYRAQAAATGFKTTVLDLNYDANQPSAFAFTLSPGSVSETVQVAAATAQVQTDTAKIGSTISSNTITQLPLNGRSVH